MSAKKMRADEVETDAAPVERLVAVQFPEWAGLAIEPVDSSGTDNFVVAQSHQITRLRTGTCKWRFETADSGRGSYG